MQPKKLAIFLGFILAIVVPISHSATAADVSTLSATDITKLVNDFADCAGFYDYLAGFTLAQNKPANADAMSNLANGAKSSALYLLGMDYAMTHRDGPRRSYGSFSPMVDGRRETELARLKAVEENNDQEALNDRGVYCQSLLPIQEEIVSQMRSDTADREQEAKTEPGLANASPKSEPLILYRCKDAKDQTRYTATPSVGCVVIAIQDAGNQ